MAWKTTILGVILTLLGLQIQYHLIFEVAVYELNIPSLLLIIAGGALILSPDTVIDGLKNWIQKNTKS